MTTKEALEKLLKVIDEISDEELVELLKSANVTEEDARQYAKLEKMITGPIFYKVARGGRPDQECSFCRGSGKMEVCGGKARPCSCTDTPC